METSVNFNKFRGTAFPNSFSSGFRFRELSETVERVLSLEKKKWAIKVL